MISPEELINSISNTEESPEFSDDDGWGSDFDDPITERFAQEIQENRINEKREDALSKIGSYENSIMEEPSKLKSLIEENFATNSASNTGALPKTGFSYLVSNSSPKILEHQISATSFEYKSAIKVNNPKNSEIKNSVANTSHSLESTVSSTNLLQQNSNASFQASTDKKTPGKLRPEAFDFLKKLNSPEIVRTDDINNFLEVENTETIISPPPLPARPPPIFKYPLLNFSKQTADISQTRLNPVNKCTTQTPLDISNTIQSQSENKGLGKRNVDNETKSRMRNQVSSEEQPKKQSTELQLEVIPQPLIKRPTSIPINKSLRNLLENTDYNLKSCAKFETHKTEPELKTDASRNVVKPQLPIKPDKIRNQRLEKIIIGQHKSDLKLPPRKSESSMETKIIDVPATKINNCDELDIPIVDNMKDYPQSRKSLTAVPSSSWKDSTMTQITNSPNENQDDKLQFPDFDSWHHAMDRPTLPQKLRSTQRSVSCNSLVQSFKDLSLAIWFPPEKERKNSTTSSNIKISRKIGKEDLIISPVCLSTPPVIEEPTLSEEKSLTPMEQASITRNLWYHEIDASEAQRRLLKLDLDGAFLVRPSSRPTSNIHYTVSVTHSGRVLNTHIREKKNGHYAIGKEKEDEKTFASISELIKYYQDVPFAIRPSGSSSSYGICFRVTPPR